jgi:hypothetical protein
MTGFPLARAAAVVALASLAATAGPPAATASTASGRPRPPAARLAPAGAPWPSRTVLRESARARSATQVLSPARGADFALVPVNRQATVFQLRRTSLATGAIRTGPRFSVSGLRLASGFLWVYGPVYSGPDSSRVRLVLHQVSVPALRVVRSWTLLPTRRLVSLAMVAVAPGPGRTVWVGFRRTLRLVSVTSGATLRRARVPAGFSITDVDTDPARQRLYAAAAPSRGGAAVFEYQARSGLQLAAATGQPLIFSLSGASLTAVPGRVWASFRTGMAGETVLLRQRELTVVPLHRPVFDWFMGATTLYGGGALWLATEAGVMACVRPQSGAVALRTTLPGLRDSGELVAVGRLRHVVYAIGRHGVIAIAPPLACWG